MKSIISFFLVIIIFSFISCSKNKDTQSPKTVFDLIQKHVWIQDSFYNTYNIDTFRSPFINYDTSVRITFTPTTYTNRYLPTSPVTTYVASYESPNKVYYWFPTEQKDPALYLLINSVDERNLTTRKIFGLNNQTQVIYYHAR